MVACIGVFGKNCSTQATDTSVQVDIFLEIVPYFDFVDCPFFKIKIKSKPFRDDCSPSTGNNFGPCSQAVLNRWVGIFLTLFPGDRGRSCHQNIVFDFYFKHETVDTVK